jgi:hypothetical protein
MEPANSIITALGGPTAVARAIGVHRTRVSMWKAPREKGGTNGIIPHWQVPKVLKMAEEIGVPLSREDFAPMPQGAARQHHPAA